MPLLLFITVGAVHAVNTTTLPRPKFSKTFLSFIASRPDEISLYSHDQSQGRRIEHEQIVTEFQFMFSKAGKRYDPQSIEDHEALPLVCRGDGNDANIIRTSELTVCLGAKHWKKRCAEACPTSSDDDRPKYKSDPTSQSALSDLEACCATHTILSGWSCEKNRSSRLYPRAARPPCYAMHSGTEIRRRKHNENLIKNEDSSYIHVAVAGGLIDATGMIVAARSIVDTATQPDRLKLYFATDAEKQDLKKIKKALDCALGSYGIYYSVGSITQSFLESRSETFRHLYAVDELNRTRPNLVKASANYARIFLPDLFPELKNKLVIYLDCDVLLHDDIATLSREAVRALNDADSRITTDRGDPAVAATLKTRDHAEYGAVWRRRYPDHPREIAVFNSGVMVIDFSRWAAQGLTREVEGWIDQNLIGGSQLPINLAVASNFASIGSKWNCPIRTGKVDEVISIPDGACISHPGVRHWTGRAKPWVKNGRLMFYWYPVAYRVRKCLRDLYDAPPFA